MALFQTRITLHSYVRIAIGQRMWLHLILSYKLCFQQNLTRLPQKPENDRNRMSIFRALYKTKQITKYETMQEKGQDLATIKFTQYTQLSTHLTNSNSSEINTFLAWYYCGYEPSICHAFLLTQFSQHCQNVNKNTPCQGTNPSSHRYTLQNRKPICKAVTTLPLYGSN